ncbi:hypothetical protein ACNOYE_08765 [Nannocystaceae bacterium ST9]
MTWIVTQSSTMLGTLPADRLDSHYRVLQREAGVLILAANASTAMFENYESATSLRILDLCERLLDASVRGEGLLDAIAAGLRELVAAIGEDGAAWLTALWVSGDRLELWSNGRDDLVVFAGERTLVQRCSPRFRIGPIVVTMVGTGPNHAEEPIERLHVGERERLRVVVMHRMSDEMSFIPALMGWQRKRGDAEVRELVEQAHGWVFDRGQKVGLIAGVDLIST